jgi:hypothetical protein
MNVSSQDVAKLAASNARRLLPNTIAYEQLLAQLGQLHPMDTLLKTHTSRKVEADLSKNIPEVEIEIMHHLYEFWEQEE